MYRAAMRVELLERYVCGECTVVERIYVERWLEASPKWRELLAQLIERSPAASEAQRAEIRARLVRALELGPNVRGDGG